MGYEGIMTTVGGNDTGDGYNYKGDGERNVTGRESKSKHNFDG